MALCVTVTLHVTWSVLCIHGACGKGTLRTYPLLRVPTQCATLLYAPADCHITSPSPLPLSVPAHCHLASLCATLLFALPGFHLIPCCATASQCVGYVDAPPSCLPWLVGTSPCQRRHWYFNASAIKAYCCTARITLGSEIVFKLWVYIYQAQR